MSYALLNKCRTVRAATSRSAPATDTTRGGACCRPSWGMIMSDDNEKSLRENGVEPERKTPVWSSWGIGAILVYVAVKFLMHIARTHH